MIGTPVADEVETRNEVDEVQACLIRMTASVYDFVSLQNAFPWTAQTPEMHARVFIVSTVYIFPP